MKKLWDLKKVFSNLEPEGRGRGIIMGVTCLLLLRSFYTIQTQKAQTFLGGVYTFYVALILPSTNPIFDSRKHLLSTYIAFTCWEDALFKIRGANSSLWMVKLSFSLLNFPYKTKVLLILCNRLQTDSCAVKAQPIA